MSITHCPKCNADFQGEPIPQKYIDAGHYGTETHYSRVIGVSSWETDRVESWLCPDCGHQWKRDHKPTKAP